jgi:hypothetical protein
VKALTLEGLGIGFLPTQVTKVLLKSRKLTKAKIKVPHNYQLSSHHQIALTSSIYRNQDPVLNMLKNEITQIF